MERFLGRYSPYAYALMRIVIGLLFACHGGQKILGMFADPAHPMSGPLPPIAMVGGYIELIGGFMVAFGLFGGTAAFICSGMMAVAYFMAHAKGGFFPIVNHGEPAVMYCFVFLLIACRGSGVLSVDQLINRSASATDRSGL